MKNDIERLPVDQIDKFIGEIQSALSCNPRGAWMPSEALTQAFITEILALRKELDDARKAGFDANDVTDAEESGWRNGLEAAAELIETRIVINTGTGRGFRPRDEGNQDGLFYADAIRKALAHSGEA